ncbi:hypothetical protein P3T36_007917 [Kitasatospora sp. MAP12-15]|uniref:hypothetical protein n=1 Tax=unclassified Kitasatospora TaxID=2633591 RepID=UPI0024737D00|nr:hypothetical protein [Kitasatospora sp. MAP12-44]MDH6113650.1 hypothetical protein [Kitasatospora sp. MAP12-44]
MTQETAAALLARRDVHGLRSVLAALACATEDWTADQLSAEVDCNPHWFTEKGTIELVGHLEILASEEEPGVRDEARRLLARMR